MTAAWLRSGAIGLALTCVFGCTELDSDEGAAPGGDVRLARMVTLCSTHHALAPAQLDQLGEEDVRVLRALARDRDRPLWLRARAVSLAGVRPSAETRALWRELRSAPEGELRVEAAWAEGLSLAQEPQRTFAIRLLQDEEPAVREAGAHLLAIAGGEAARAFAQEHLRTEPDVVVRAVLSRKLLSR